MRGGGRRSRRPEGIKRALDMAVRQMGFDGGVVYTLKDRAEEGSLSLVSCKGIDNRTRDLISSMAKDVSPTLKQGPDNVATRAVGELPAGEPGAAAVGRVLKDVGMKTVTSLPLMMDDDLLGSLELLSRSDRKVTAPEVSMIQLVGSHIASLLHARRLRNRLRVARARLDSLAGTMEDVTYQVDLDGGRFTSVNTAMEGLTGYGSELFLASTFTDWVGAAVHPEDQKALLESWKTQTTSHEEGDGKPVESLYRLIDAKGGVHQVSDRRKVMRDRRGRPLHVFGIVRDMSPRMTLEADLSRKDLELKLVSSVAAAMEEDLPSGKLGGRILDVILEGTGFTHGALWVPHPDGQGKWILLTARPNDGPLAKPGAWKRGGEAKKPVFEHAGEGWGEETTLAEEGEPGTVCSLPCVHQGKRAGLFLLGSEERREPSDEELRLLRLISTEAALALRNAGLRDELDCLEIEGPTEADLEGYAQTMARLETTERSLNLISLLQKVEGVAVSADELAGKTTEILTGAAGASTGLLYILNREDGSLRLKGWTGIPQGSAGRLRNLDSRSPAVKGLLDTEGARLLPAGTLTIPTLSEAFKGDGENTVLCVPLRDAESGEGLMLFGYPRGEKPAEGTEEVFIPLTGYIGRMVSGTGVREAQEKTLREVRTKLGAAGIDLDDLEGLAAMRSEVVERKARLDDLESDLHTARGNLNLSERLNSCNTADEVLKAGLDNIVEWENILAPAAIVASRPGTEGMQVAVDQGFFNYGPGQDGLPAPHAGCPRDMGDFLQGVLRTATPMIPKYTIVFISADHSCFAFNLKLEGRPFALGVAHHSGSMGELSELGSRLDALGAIIAPLYLRLIEEQATAMVAKNTARFNHYAVSISSDLDPSRIFELTLGSLSEGAYFDAAMVMLTPAPDSVGIPPAPGDPAFGPTIGPDTPLEPIPLKKDALQPAPIDRAVFMGACTALARQCLSAGRGHLISTIREGTTDGIGGPFFDEGYRSAAGIPLMAEGRGVGTLILLSRHSGGLGSEEYRFAEGIARFLAPALEKSRALALLRDKGAALDRLLNRTPEMWVMFDSSGKPTRASRSTRDLTGRSAADFVDGSTDLVTIAHVDDRGMVEGYLNRARRGEVVPEVEFRVPDLEGEPQWVMMTLQPMDTPSESGTPLLAVLRDIGSFKDREGGLEAVARHLESNNRELQELLSWWEELAASSGHEAFLRSVLGHAMKSGGYDVGCVYKTMEEGRAMRLAVHEGTDLSPVDDPTVVPLEGPGLELADLLEGGELVHHAEVRTLDLPILGTRTPGELHGSVIAPVEEGGRLLGMLCMARTDAAAPGDLTRAHGALNGLRRVLAASILEQEVRTGTATEMMEAREDIRFYSDLVPHDLHNINTGALGYLELAMGAGVESEDRERYLRQAFSLIVRSSVLMENVRRLRGAREAGGEEDVDLDAAIRGSVANIGARYPDKELVPQYVPVPASVRAPRAVVEDILLNLLDNTVKYSSSTRIPVDFDVDPLADGDRVRVRLQDRNGPLPRGQKEDFHGALPDDALVPRPAQLGRYMVGRLVRDIGGDITVGDLSEAGDVVGTEYTLTMPRGGSR